MMNENLKNLQSDFLYHLGINIPKTADTTDIQRQFGDIKIICMGGTKLRMQSFATHIRNELFPETREINENLIDLCEEAHRYAVYKVGPILCANHGIGMPSMSVLLHELIKLMEYAKCKDCIFIRIGTSGGLGVAPGSIVVTKNAYNGYLRNEHETAVLGERIVRPAKFNEKIVNEILECSRSDDKFDIIPGNTMAANCFYEGQGRLDGAICSYTEADKITFLRKCHDEFGIRNIEMEATMFGSLTWHLGLKAAIVCLTFLDRFHGDQVVVTPILKKEFEQRVFDVVTRYIKRILNLPNK